MDMIGKTVMITGASGGIGLAMAYAFGYTGADLIIGDLKPVEHETYLDLAEKTLSNILELRADVTSDESVSFMVEYAISNFKKIDVLINAAGISKNGYILKQSMEDWHKVIDVNLTGTYRCIREVVKHMKDARSGSIINISSVIGEIGNIGQAAYSASKAGVIGLTKTVAKEFAAFGIRCNAIAPGYINTPMLNDVPDDKLEAMINLTPLKRLGTPEEIAEAAVFLANAGYITGQVLGANGGMNM
jgi:3-oxoacyl-[acyl-carrier protein] reductase